MPKDHSLATKYRPKTWEDMTEQTVLVDILKNMCSAPELRTRNFLFIGPAGTGKTTSARLMANIINDGKGEPIEIDAASNSGVDAMREIIQQARSYPVVGNYKVFIVDECFTGDTKILTNKGFKRFDELDHSELIAQYKDDGSIEFVKPLRWIKKDYKGEMIRFKPKYYSTGVLMTPHHVQPLYNFKCNTLTENYIKDTKLKLGDRCLLSGKGCGNNGLLTSMEKLIIAVIADGYRKELTLSDKCIWYVRLKRDRKIDRLMRLLAECNVSYSYHITDDGVNEFAFPLPKYITKNISDSFKFDFGYDRARNFIEEIMQWDGSYKSGYDGYFSSTIKDNTDFVSQVALLGGYSIYQKVKEYDNPNYSIEYQVSLCDCTYNKKFKPSIEKGINYEGEVYCVEVPSHKIIIQGNDGFAFVSGNCHSLSQQAWQSLLKTLEESPAKSVFIFCTTNPEKIPATILSRVSTYQLSKISLKGIYDRLIHVIECENKEGQNITYAEDAVNFIAKLANGGMRDALTLLDKALAYSKNITSDNLSKSLNLPNYDDYFSLLSYIAKKDNSNIAELVDRVYNSGVNFIKWFEGFHSFVMNIVKYILLQDIDSTMIPSHYYEKISKYDNRHLAICIKLANKLIKLNQELKSTNYQQELVLTYLCSVPNKNK